eukprot:SAG22_NODE_517_length_9528_cov_3.821508_6_plen_491_part_00
MHCWNTSGGRLGGLPSDHLAKYPVWPSEVVNRADSPDRVATAQATCRAYSTNQSLVYGRDSIGFIAAVLAGTQPPVSPTAWTAEEIVRAMESVEGFTEGPGGQLRLLQFGNRMGMGMSRAVDEMLVSAPGGKYIELFPMWPRGSDAAFRNLRVKGAFLVSANYSARSRSVTYLTVEGAAVDAAQQRECIVKSPWHTKRVSVSCCGEGSKMEVAVTPGTGLFSFCTQRGCTCAIAAVHKSGRLMTDDDASNREAASTTADQQPNLDVSQLAQLDIDPILMKFIGSIVTQLHVVEAKNAAVGAELSQVKNENVAVQNRTRVLEAENKAVRGELELVKTDKIALENKTESVESELRQENHVLKVKVHDLQSAALELASRMKGDVQNISLRLDQCECEVDTHPFFKEMDRRRMQDEETLCRGSGMIAMFSACCPSSGDSGGYRRFMQSVQGCDALPSTCSAECAPLFIEYFRRMSGDDRRPGAGPEAGVCRFVY